MQSAKPVTQVYVQRLALQAAVECAWAGQAVQEPQCIGSDVTSMHEVPQRLCPVAHPVVHRLPPLLPEQSGAVELHAVPHAPQ